MRPALVTLRARFPALTVRVAPAWIATLFVVVEFWTVCPWAGWAKALAASTGARAIAAVAFVATASRAAGALDVDAPLRRLLPRARIGPTLLPVAIYAALPALAGAWLLPGGPLLRVVGWAAALLWLGRGDRVVPIGALAIAEALGPARIVVDLALLLGYGRGARAARPATAGGWRPASAWGAVLGRDLLCLWRTQRRHVLAAFAVAPWPAVLVWGLRRNGGLDAGARATAIGALLCAISVGGAAAVAALRERLGWSFAPRAWPVPPGLRVASVAVVFALWLAPTHAAMAATGGVGPALVPVPVVVMLAAGAAWLSTWSALNLGLYGAWALGALALVLAGRPAWGLAAALPALWHAARRLR